MAHAIVITKKRSNTETPWIQSSIDDKSSFTDDEYEHVIQPYWHWIQSLNGFQTINMNSLDDLTKETIYIFDTEENAQLAWRVMMGGGENVNTLQNPLAKNRNKLLKLKAGDDAQGTIGTHEFKEI